MLLDIGATVCKDENYNIPNDISIPNFDEFEDDFEDILEENDDNDNNNDISINFNADVVKMDINDILNEMRMSSPILNDFFNDTVQDETSQNSSQYENDDSQGSDTNPDDCDNDYQNDDSGAESSEDMTKDDGGDVMDQLLCHESCSIPDMEMEHNDGIQFKYDASEQINCEPDITLSYPEEAESTAVAVQDSNKPSEPEAKSDQDGTVVVKQFFECSTSLPMSSTELNVDIQEYIRMLQIYNHATFCKYDTIYNEDDTITEKNNNTLELPGNSVMLQDNNNEQNHLFQNLDPVTPIDDYEPQNSASSEVSDVYECNFCLFYSKSMHGLGVHMRIHSKTCYNCTECNFKTNKGYLLRRHIVYVHGTVYSCRACDYKTYSDSKIRIHVRDEH